jgi:hypothetical protein
MLEKNHSRVYDAYKKEAEEGRAAGRNTGVPASASAASSARFGISTPPEIRHRELTPDNNFNLLQHLGGGRSVRAGDIGSVTHAGFQGARAPGLKAEQIRLVIETDT